MIPLKERPIIFSAPMVRAILDDRKTVTRRVIAPAWPDQVEAALPFCGHRDTWVPPLPHDDQEPWYEQTRTCRYGKPGDRLWVRETCAINDYRQTALPVEERSGCQIFYRADGNPDLEGEETLIRWRPSIHMPRWASRVLLEITDVRVERLQDGNGEIDWESRYLAEGINRIHHGDGAYCYHPFKTERGPGNWIDPFDAWRELWISINGADSWNANPWVWVVEFKRVMP